MKSMLVRPRQAVCRAIRDRLDASRRALRRHRHRPQRPRVHVGRASSASTRSRSRARSPRASPPADEQGRHRHAVLLALEVAIGRRRSSLHGRGESICAPPQPSGRFASQPAGSRAARVHGRMRDARLVQRARRNARIAHRRRLAPCRCRRASRRRSSSSRRAPRSRCRRPSPSRRSRRAAPCERIAQCGGIDRAGCRGRRWSPPHACARACRGRRRDRARRRSSRAWRADSASIRALRAATTSVRRAGSGPWRSTPGPSASTSRATANASAKPRERRLGGSRIRTSRRCCDLILDVADGERADAERLPCRAGCRRPSRQRRRVPAGGTALTSAATAGARCARSARAAPARPRRRRRTRHRRRASALQRSRLGARGGLQLHAEALLRSRARRAARDGLACGSR